MQSFYLENKEIKEYASTNEEILFSFLLYLSTATEEYHEIYVFRQFLESHLHIDELDFYLHCRNILFSGPQPLTGEPMCFVPLESVHSVIETMMKGMPPEEIEALKLKLTEKSLNNSTIEACIALKTLLGYYQLEKVLKFTDHCGSAIIDTFERFDHVCRRIWPARDIYDLYDLCWRVDGSQIRPETLYKVANEQGYFYGILKLRKHGRLYDEAVFDEWEKNADLRRSVSQISTKLGVPYLKDRIAQYEHQLNPHSYKKPEDLGVFHIKEVSVSYMSFVEALMQVMAKITN